LGHEAMTCINEPGACPGESLIAIADPCAHAYMNEASNSWVLTGQSSAPIAPYGAGEPSGGLIAPRGDRYSSPRCPEMMRPATTDAFACPVTISTNTSLVNE